MKLKLLLRMFEVLHNDLKTIYGTLVVSALCGDDKNEEKYEQYMNAFDASYNLVRIDAKEEVKKEEKR